MPTSNGPPARVLFSSSFVDPSRSGNGGHRRAQQLIDLLTGANLSVALPSSVRDTMGAGLRNARWKTVMDYAGGLKIGVLRRARATAGFARNYGDWRRGLARYPDARVLVWEDTRNAHTMRAAKDAGLRIVAVPQNLESLGPGMHDDRTGQGLPWSLEYEIRQLALADRVYAISREEQWFLRLRGIGAEYLPFFPDPHQRERWLTLRRRRSGPFDRYVVLGSAVNPPTRAGMQELLSWMKAGSRPRLPVHVVGYGTEVLRELAGDGITIHGALPDGDLEEHLCRARAVVLHQQAAIGALIRVSEMLLAGVPVVASAIAARSTSQYQGVAVYESFLELASLLERETWEVPPTPQVPQRLERQFVDAVAAWAR